jgi:diguanylate cyclase (GGDEF)-like protein/PAS domain S-box-containing protein
MNSNVVRIDQKLSYNERLIDAIDLPIGRWNREGRLLYCNAPYLTWAGSDRSQLLGRTMEEIYGPDAWAAARDAFAAAFEGRTVRYERMLTHQKRPARWARVQVFPDRDAEGKVTAVFTIAFDIHDDVITRETLEVARRRLDRFAENIPYPLTYVDSSCVIRFVNKAWVEGAGMAADEALGRHIGEVRGAKRWAEHRPYFERALAGESVHYTRLAELARQGPRWLRTSYVPDFDPQGTVIGVYTVTVDVHELTIAQERLRRSVERDALTDVYSRRAMMDRIDAAVADAHEHPVALFFIDLDNLKAVNDTRGHREGDELLVRTAGALADAVRAEDSVGRFGGDEFLVLAHVRDAAGAQSLAQHLLQALHDAVAALPLPQRATASIGYALAPADSVSALKLVQRADDAMYAAKRLGGNRVLHCAVDATPEPSN